MDNLNTGWNKNQLMFIRFVIPFSSRGLPEITNSYMAAAEFELKGLMVCASKYSR
jgi:hypothetical protein